MYYLVIKNLGVEKCIDKNTEDIYNNNQSYDCKQALPFEKKEQIRIIKIRCTGISGKLVNALVYRD
jgi:hypothetical protein